MRKLSVIITILTLALMSTVGIVSATPVDELTSLAEYAPEGSPVFAVIRTDAGYIETLDGLAARLSAAVGQPMGDSSVTDLIDLALRGLPTVVPASAPTDFATDIRPWLGDSVAVMLTGLDMNMDPTQSIVFALSVSDNAAAEAWANDYGTLVGWGVPVETEDGLFYDMRNNNNSAVLLADGVMFVGLATALETVVMPGDDLVNLTQTSEFTDVIGALPEDDYNALVYIDGELLITEIAPFFEMMSGQSPGTIESMGMGSIEDMAGMAGQQAMGLTLLEGRSLVMDYAIAGNETEYTQSPVDLSILEHIPADTILAAVNSGAGDMVNQFFVALEMLDQMMTENDMTMSEMGDLPPALDIINFNSLSVFIRQMYEGTTGLNLDETLDLLNGTNALYVSIDPQDVQGLTVPVPSPGVLFMTDDADASAAYVESMAGIVTDIFANATFEDGVLTLPANELGLVVPEEFREIVALLDMQLASGDGMIVFGRPATVGYALDPQGANLTDIGTYEYESGLFLEDPTSVWLINVPPVIAPLIDFLTESGMATESDIEMLESLLQIVATSSITTSENNARFTITLTQ
ncbi:MAG: DUF3352 domain-containing protein [Aggregatilineales bacterium]